MHRDKLRTNSKTSLASNAITNNISELRSLIAQWVNNSRPKLIRSELANILLQIINNIADANGSSGFSDDTDFVDLNGEDPTTAGYNPTAPDNLEEGDQITDTSNGVIWEYNGTTWVQVFVPSLLSFNRILNSNCDNIIEVAYSDTVIFEFREGTLFSMSGSPNISDTVSTTSALELRGENDTGDLNVNVLQNTQKIFRLVDEDRSTCSSVETIYVENWHNTTYVDSIYGSNVTGLYDRADKPFKNIRNTISHLRAKGLLMNSDDVQTIRVRAGEYFEGFIAINTGEFLNIHYDIGAKHYMGSLFATSGSVVNITGNGVFIVNGNQGEINFGFNSTITLEADAILSVDEFSNKNPLIINATQSANIKVKEVLGRVSVTNYANFSNFGLIDSKVHLEIDKIVAPIANLANIFMDSGVQQNLEVYINNNYLFAETLANSNDFFHANVVCRGGGLKTIANFKEVTNLTGTNITIVGNEVAALTAVFIQDGTFKTDNSANVRFLNTNNDVHTKVKFASSCVLISQDVDNFNSLGTFGNNEVYFYPEVSMNKGLNNSITLMHGTADVSPNVI